MLLSCWIEIGDSSRLGNPLLLRLVFAVVFTAHWIGRHCSIPHRFRSSSSLSLTVSEIDYDKLSALKRKFFKNNYLMARISARGGLEPHFRVLFSAIFHGVPWRISIRVETCGK